MDHFGWYRRTSHGGAPPTLPLPVAPSNGESEVGASDAELPSPLHIVPKVCQADDVEHTLNKGLWVGTGAKRWGWRIYIGEFLSVTFHVGCLLILSVQDQLMTCIPTCQRCQALRHECYGLPNRVCGRW